MRLRGPRWLWVVAIAAVVVGVGVLGAVWRQTRSALDQAAIDSADASVLKFTAKTIDRGAPPGVTALSSPPNFRDAVAFDGRLVLVGAGGLTEYDSRGVLVRHLRPGLELPATALTSVATVVLDPPDRSLIVGTASDGFLIVERGSVRHFRPALPALRKITTVLPVGGPRTLLGTESGVMVFDGRTLSPAHPELTAVPVTALAGVEGDVWIGTRDRGVLHWHAGQVDRLGEEQGLPDSRVLSLCVHDTRAYVGTALGVAELEGGRYVRTLGDGLFARAIAVAGDTLVVGTVEGAIARIPLGPRGSHGIRPLDRDLPIAVERFVSIQGVLDAVTDDGLAAFDDRTATWRTVVSSRTGTLTDGNVSALAMDAAGRLWVGYFDRGLDILDASGTRVSHVENDRVFCVNRIVHDAQGRLTAVATANGLVLFDGAGRQKQVLGRADGLIADHITDLVVTPERITVATPAGLTFIDPNGPHSIYAFHGLVNNHVYALGVSDHALLAGTLGGVSVLERDTVRASYTTANSGLTHNWITAVRRVGAEWFVGTYGGGLFRLDDRGNWHTFADATGAFEVNPSALEVTDTHVFAGTLTRGLLVYDRRVGRWVFVTSGLPSLNVTALASAHGELLVGTDNGVMRLSPDAFNLP
jgi:ligand-binding sensor domain-containing protein